MSRNRRLIAAGAGAVLIGTLLASSLMRPSANDSVSSRSPREAQAVPAPSPSTIVTPSPTVPGAARSPEMRSYALAAAELDGLPVDAAPGTVMDLWVAWDPPLTRRPEVRPLVRDVVLERIAPPVTADGPFVAILLIREDAIPDLIYGDRYGALSVTLAPPS